MIDAELTATIVRLATVEGWPVGTIASQLRVHHDVVERVLRQHGLPKATISRPSRVDRFLPFIQETWAKYPKLPASRLFQMCRDRGFKGHPDRFRHSVARFRPRAPAEAFLRLRTLPGEQGQVDWAHFGHRAIGRAKRPLVAFVMVLSYSRALFVRFMLSYRTEDFLAGHESAFAHFGALPRVLLYDNLKSAVLERRGEAIRFNPTLLAFAGHYRFEPRPVSVARGNEKGRVERAIGYVRTAFFEALPFRDVDELNAKALAFCEGAAMERRWPEDVTRTVREAYAEERASLLALPANPFDTAERREVAVGRTPYVRFDGNDYSVPHTLVRRTLTVRATQDEVRIFDGQSEVARHERSYDARGQIEDPAHVAALVETKRRARGHRGADRLAYAAPSSRALLARLAERGMNLGHATMLLMRLLRAHSAEALEAAIAEALAGNVAHVHGVRQVLERHHAARGRAPEAALPWPENAPGADVVVRPHDLSTYDQLARQDEGPKADPTEGGLR